MRLGRAVRSGPKVLGPAESPHRTVGRRRVGHVAAGLVAVAVVAGGCNSVDTLNIPTPPRLGAAAATTTTAAGAPTVAEVPVAGSSPSTSVAINPGSASITGTALGPSGPVEGATVEVQRFVGDASATIEATTAADGSFDIPRILGGRYVVRAWRAPSLAETAPQVFFLAGSGTQTLNLQMTSFSGLKVATAINPETPFTGQPVDLAIEVTQPTVDQTGDVSQVPQVSVTVRLESNNFIPTGGGPSIATTGLNGEAILGITCTQSGPAPITLLVGGSTTVSLDTPFCISSETTSTTATTVAPTTTSVPTRSFGPTTTTSRPSTTVTPTTAHGSTTSQAPTTSILSSPTPTAQPTTTAGTTSTTS
ncbi:MAG: carboxypeptidase-like regulatory domain-containing protein [Acidimicrobiaceae bacterium]|nr:carboxypeptidase-like regulatory domain-containing protein [Acidimicrobiaceae bacterium]